MPPRQRVHAVACPSCYCGAGNHTAPEKVASDLRELLKKQREEHVATAERMTAAEDRVHELEAAAAC